MPPLPNPLFVVTFCLFFVPKTLRYWPKGMEFGACVEKKWYVSNNWDMVHTTLDEDILVYR